MKEILDIILKTIIGFIGIMIIAITPISYLIGMAVLIIGCYSIGYGICEFIKNMKK